ncbi:MAG: metallophosphoesterase family protein [Lachnospiraceae bacterium]|jgi:putative phosphoesterase|nr:metallophosphoesterase family protein [Lachnospiraceae bacterium]
MKIIFFSDVHGNRYAVEQFFKDIKNISYDRLIFGGDVFGYYYEADKILSIFREKKVQCLLGNHDRMFLDLLEGKREEQELVKRYGNSYKKVSSKISIDNIEFLYSFSDRFEFEADGLRLVFLHGTITDSLNGRIYPDTVIQNFEDYKGINIVFSGHTHHKMIRKLSNGCTIINPGSLGQQRDGKGCSYIIFDTNLLSYEIRIVYYDLKPLITDIMEIEEKAEMKEKLIEVLCRNR